jgi:hypothetical protein
MGKTLVSQILRILLCVFVFYYIASCILGIRENKTLIANSQSIVTAIRLREYADALGRYYAKYERYPYSCTNIEELVYVLEGHSLRGCNSSNRNFFSCSANNVPISKRICDGYGQRLVLIRKDDKTNLIVRSIAVNHVNSEGKRLYYEEVDTSTFKQQNKETKNEESLKH